MTNKPKAIGTAAETAVLRAILPYFANAHRNVQHGSKDEGDIWASDDFVIEVKGGRQTLYPGDAMLQDWWRQTLEERDHAKAKHGILVIQRAGYGAPRALRWWAYLSIDAFAALVGSSYDPVRPAPETLIRLELNVLLDLIADLGLSDSYARK